MKNIDTKKLRKSVTFYIVLTTAILMIVSIVGISIVQENRQAKKEKKYEEMVQKEIKDVVKHYFQDYSYRLKRIVKTE